MIKYKKYVQKRTLLRHGKKMKTLRGRGPISFGISYNDMWTPSQMKSLEEEIMAQKTVTTFAELKSAIEDSTTTEILLAKDIVFSSGGIDRKSVV